MGNKKEVFWEAAADAVEVERDGYFVAFDDRVYAVHVGVEGGELRMEVETGIGGSNQSQQCRRTSGWGNHVPAEH